ncbi:hypothetical protein N7470_007304 [Penicillium chermesinum]|nr:hypothetical protein N7470_007304 [Penicillium chermesinum]
MQISTALVGLLASLPCVLGSKFPLHHRNTTAPPTKNIQPEVEVKTLFQFPNNGSWIDNVVLRSNGNLLFTLLDAPEVWSVDPKTGNASVAHSFPNATSCFGISEIDDDVFAVVVGNFSTKTYAPTAGSFSVQKLDFNKAGAGNERVSAGPAASVIAAVPEAQALNGMTTFTKESNLVLIADSPIGAVWKVDIKSGEYKVALNDTAMTPAEGVPLPLGVNGLKVLNGYMYFSSTTRMQYGRVKLNDDGTAAGDFEIIASGFLPDNLDIAKDGTAYIATDPQNSVVRVTPSGQISLVAGGQLSTKIPGATSCRLTDDEKTLYVGTSGGQVAPVLGTFMEPAKIVQITFK